MVTCCSYLAQAISSTYMYCLHKCIWIPLKSHLFWYRFVLVDPCHSFPAKISRTSYQDLFIITPPVSAYLIFPTMQRFFSGKYKRETRLMNDNNKLILGKWTIGVTLLEIISSKLDIEVGKHFNFSVLNTYNNHYGYYFQLTMRNKVTIQKPQLLVQKHSEILLETYSTVYRVIIFFYYPDV